MGKATEPFVLPDPPTEGPTDLEMTEDGSCNVPNFHENDLDDGSSNAQSEETKDEDNG